MEESNLIPVLYVGKKDRKVDTVAGTGLVWTRGEIHYLPPLIATKLTRYADVWREGWDEAEADPARVGLVVQDGSLGGATGAPQTEQSQVPPFNMPNLQGMNKGDLVTFALGQFNQQLDAGLKKDEMIQQIISLANSRAAGELN